MAYSFLLSLSLLLLLPCISSKFTKEEMEEKEKLWGNGEAPKWYKNFLDGENPIPEVQLDREHGLLTLPHFDPMSVRYDDDEFSLVFLHVPKSGGMSLRKALKGLTYPTRGVYRPNWQEFVQSPCELKEKTLLSSFQRSTCKEPLIVWGTDTLGACKVLNKTKCVHFTAIRNPIDVCLSHYEYFCQRGMENKKFWDWRWKKCEKTMLEWATDHCQNILIDALSIDNYNLFTTRTFTPKEFKRIKDKFNLREKMEVAQHNLRNIFVMHYENGLALEWNRFLRVIGFEGRIPRLPHINARDAKASEYEFIPVNRNDQKLRQELEEILWADMQVYQQYMGEEQYHLQTLLQHKGGTSGASSPSLSLSLLFCLSSLSLLFHCLLSQ